MVAPDNFEKMSDEELLDELKKSYNESAARYVLKVLRGQANQIVNPFK